MKPKPFDALNHLTVPFSMEHVLSCVIDNPTQPSGKVYAELADRETTNRISGSTREPQLINGVSTLKGVGAVRQRFRSYNRSSEADQEGGCFQRRSCSA